ncbi:Uncharacterized conserved protein, MAPEG superfamily [Parasphingorhabdus marina DSM 22363]|uniref:Uncharacterized conserved protein, MAPEG superfamily n=1 Tax=Parasphingorhabdus marina DSM 22363 TaxID=1123272 RepID=A0A1N6GXX2_9SPHN|nr:MAPEG family protein [Parasphingorhabdus marina]SIO12225.1 Uncharacterized conserved protein, MAPEG superfamily [Parasphingorhabdus marina DSM 22363]
MTFELAVAGWLTIIYIALVMLQGGLVPGRQGFAWGLGSRDELPEKSIFQRRVDRTVANHGQAMLMFVPLLVLGELAGISNDMTRFAAGLFLTGRLFFAPLYLAGVAYWRSAAFGLTLIAMVMFLGQLLPAMI